MAPTATKPKAQRKRYLITADIGKKRSEKVAKMAAELGVNKTAVIERALDELQTIEQRRHLHDMHEQITAGVYHMDQIFTSSLIHMGNLARLLAAAEREGRITAEFSEEAFQALGVARVGKSFDEALQTGPELKVLLDNYAKREPMLQDWSVDT